MGSFRSELDEFTLPPLIANSVLTRLLSYPGVERPKFDRVPRRGWCGKAAPATKVVVACYPRGIVSAECGVGEYEERALTYGSNSDI